MKIIYRVKKYFMKIKSHFFIEILKLLFGSIIIFVPGILLGFSFLKDTNSINDIYLKSIIDKFFIICSKNSFCYWLIMTIICLSFPIYLALKEQIASEDELEIEVINEKFENYIEDAHELIICGGDLDFLINSKKQLEIIKKLSRKCSIVANYDKDLTNEKEKKIYKELVDKKVKIVNIKDDKFKLKGQIKKDNLGNKTALFSVKQKSNLYKKIEIPDYEMVEILEEKVKSWHENGGNPLIRIILLDLGGVFFEGNHKEYFSKLEKELNIEIKRGKNERILLDEKLNLGEIEIVDFIQKNITRKLNEKEKEKIKDTWKKIWKPKSEMEKLVEELVKNDIKVYPCSNLDRENGESYIEKGYFSKFSDKYFFSYEMGKVKTKKEFYEEVLIELKKDKKNICPFEIMFIDDQNLNINLAKSMGFKTILFRNEKELKNQLKKEKIIK